MHDQVEALKWIQNFIGSFGGNKDNVTIMGESAGAMSCFLHYVSPLSKGLFHKVVALSGSASTPFLHNDRKPALYARRFAKEFGLNSDAPAKTLVEQLQIFSEKEIVKKTTVFKDWDNTLPLPWKPGLDSHARNPFMPISFEDAIHSGNFNKKIPILAGTMGEEGLILSAPFHKSSKRWKLFFRQWDKWAPQLFFNREAELITESDVAIVDRAFRHYFPVEATRGSLNRPNDLEAQQNIEEDDAILASGPSAADSLQLNEKYVIPQYTDSNLKKLEEILTTSWFHAPLVNDLERLVSAGSIAYTFKFCYQGSFSMVDIFRLPTFKMGLNLVGRYLGMKFYRKKLGTCHSDDLVYIFPMKRLPKPLVTDKDVHMSSLLTSYITNFAKFGTPTPKRNDENETQLFTWPTVKSCENDTVLFDEEGNVTAQKDKDEDRNHVWNNLIDSHSFRTSSAQIINLHDKVAEFRNN